MKRAASSTTTTGNLFAKEVFDVDEACDTLVDLVRAELRKWPQERVHIALHFLKQIATKEFQA